jgi:hypothetical protein
MHEAFFADIDHSWLWPGSAKVPLRVIGSAALMLRGGYSRPTKDSDVFETIELTAELRHNLTALAGKGTELHRRHGMYLDVVRNGIPFLPHRPRWTALAISLQHFELHALDVVDVSVSKLVRFHGNDRADVKAMIDRGLVPHDEFVSRFRSAVDSFAHDARADDLPRIVRNFHTAERDYFFVDESEIELPSWV